MGLLDAWLGLSSEARDLTLGQISIRGLIVFVAALMMVRFADKRFLSKMSAVDAILGFILASMLARAVNGSAAFFPTLGGGFVLVFLHKLFVSIAFRFELFGDLVKGRATLLIEDGAIQEKALQENHISEKDLAEELRQEGKLESPREVKRAYLERSGKVSVIALDKK